MGTTCMAVKATRMKQRSSSSSKGGRATRRLRASKHQAMGPMGQARMVQPWMPRPAAQLAMLLLPPMALRMQQQWRSLLRAGLATRMQLKAPAMLTLLVPLLGGAGPDAPSCGLLHP